jgi:hypothetical protein
MPLPSPTSYKRPAALAVGELGASLLQRPTQSGSLREGGLSEKVQKWGDGPSSSDDASSGGMRLRVRG